MNLIAVACMPTIRPYGIFPSPLQLMPRLKQIGSLKPFNLRLEITHLLLAGRMNLGLQV